jgi:cytochrome c5
MMDVTSTPVDPGSLPEADSRGAEILENKCTMCHGLVTPKQQAGPDWRPIVDRMDRRMNLMHGRGRMMRGGVTLTAAERAELIDYLQRNAFQPAPGELPGMGTGSAERFAAVCGQCHAPPAPDQYRAAEWPAVVDRMVRNMKNMGYGELPEADRKAVEDYLRENANPR